MTVSIQSIAFIYIRLSIIYILRKLRMIYFPIIMVEKNVGKLEENDMLPDTANVDEEILKSSIYDLKNASSRDIKEVISGPCKVIAKIFASIRKNVCPERRHWILSQKSVEGIESVLLYLRSITGSHLICDTHPNEVAVEVEVASFKLLCFECSSDTSSEKLKLSHSDSAIFLEHLQSLIRKSDHNFLNKFHLQSRRFNTFKHFAVLIHEIKFLINKEQVEIPRCHICLAQLNFGARTPILLNCDHTLCFMCYMNENNEECLIDREPIKDARTLDIDINLYGLVCHAKKNVSLLNQSMKIYKLPCMHKSCEGCIENNICKRCDCNFDSQKLKIDEKSMHIVEYLMLKCDFHNEIATEFDYVSCEARCIHCDTQECCSDFTAAPCMLEFALKENLEHFKHKKNDTRTMISTLYYKVIPLNELKKTVLNFKMRKNNKSRLPSQEIMRFSKFLPQKSISKYYKIEENQSIGMHIQCKKKILMRGIIIGESIRSVNPEGFRPVGCPLIKFFLYSPSKQTYKCSFILSAHAENNMFKILFPYSLKLNENKRYRLIINTQSCFVHGLPYSIQKNEYFTIDRLDGEQKMDNHAIGGPILGFILSEFKFLV